ncbi:MAG: putative Ig domain-containing protein, partial [Gammaproteobacteria bacterium]|nr:putative Ig domain-containing protein [Gammaproteobacteria bacterium]
ISGAPASSVVAGQAYSFTPTASDPEGQRLSFSITNRPSWATFNTNNGTLSGTPSAANVGTYNNIRISVSDGQATARLAAFAITVTQPANRAPAISGTPSASVATGQAYSFTPTASDPDGQSLTFSIQNPPSWASFNTSTGRLSGTPSVANVGTYSGIRISVSDGQATAWLPGFTITVVQANRAPTISGTPATSVTVGQAYSFTPTASDPDAGQTLQYSITNKPGWATFNTSTGRLSGTPSSANVGPYSNIRISVSDGTLSASLPAFSITVADVQTGSATLSWQPPTSNTDDSPLTNLAGYRIYYGTSAQSLGYTAVVSGSGASSYVIENLSPATWYFAVTAYNSDNVESSRSAVVSKTIQ